MTLDQHVARPGYIKSLLGEVDNNLVRTVAGYNGGPGNVARWDNSLNASQDPLLYIASIPLNETRDFVQRVMANYWMYQIRLGEPTPSLDQIAAHEWPRYQTTRGAEPAGKPMLPLSRVKVAEFRRVLGGAIVPMAHLPPIAAGCAASSADMTSLVGGAWQDKDEAAIVGVGAKLLGDLVSHDDWLPDSGQVSAARLCPEPVVVRSVRALLDRELRLGAGRGDAGARSADVGHGRHAARLGDLASLCARCDDSRCARPGCNDAERRAMSRSCSPAAGDIHQVTNALADRGSISIHVYGGNIGAVRRSTFDVATGDAQALRLGLHQQGAAQPVGPLGRDARGVAG